VRYFTHFLCKEKCFSIANPWMLCLKELISYYYIWCEIFEAQDLVPAMSLTIRGGRIRVVCLVLVHYGGAC
jgi:hypothetical protein